VEWDGEGHVTWLSTDAPVLGVALDHATTAVQLQLDGDAGGTVTIPADTPRGEPIFVALPQLEPGTHRVVAFTKSDPVVGEGRPPSQYAARGELAITVRAPRPWEPGTAEQAPLFVHPEPLRPSLEELWTGHGTLAVYGPHGQTVTATITFLDRNDGQLYAITLAPLTLPVTHEAWRSAVANIDDKEAPNALDQAYAIRVRLWTKDLGTYSLLCERTIEPFRWVVRYGKSSGHRLELIDDTGKPRDIYVGYLATNAPADAEAMRYSLRERTYPVRPPGGLYLAVSDSKYAAIVVPPQVASWQSEQMVPPPQRTDGSARGLARLMAAHRWWVTARVIAHPRAAWTQQQAVEALVCGLRSAAGTLGGGVDPRVRL
jgi:hypothetical protein